jgi:hypothetical protein
MSYAQPWRHSRLAIAVFAGAIAATSLAALTPTAAEAAALTGTITVTTPTNAKLAALTAKQVVVLTVAGTGVPALTEDSVASVGLGPTPCDALTTYVVTSATVITAKTPATCPAGVGDIVITFASGDTLTKVGGITFVAPPSIELLAVKPVINDNSAALPVLNQHQRFGTGGGQVVRVKADSSFAFDPRSAATLTASMGGKAGTEIKVYADATSSVPLASSVAGVLNNSMSFKTAAGMTDSSVTLTQNGVSKTFATAATGAVVAALPTVTSLSVQSGKAGATNVSTVITGTNFPKVLADLTDATKWLVNFCGVAATPTLASTTGLTMTVTVPDVAGQALGLGASTYAGPCPVTVTDVVATQTSAITPGSDYMVINE